MQLPKNSGFFFKAPIVAIPGILTPYALPIPVNPTISPKPT